jgi:hypothetical protein
MEGARHNVGTQGVLVLKQLGLVVFKHQQLYFLLAPTTFKFQLSLRPCYFL